MLERINEEGLKILRGIVKSIERKRKQKFFEYFIVKIINNSVNTTISLQRIDSIIKNYGYNEDMAIERLAVLFENENDEKLDNLCHFYND